MLASKSPAVLKHHINQNPAVDDLTHVGGNSVGHSDETQGFRQQDEERRRDHAAPQVSHPADNHNRKNENRFRHCEAGRVDVTDAVCVQRPRHGGEHRTDREGNHLRQIHVFAERLRENFVFAQIRLKCYEIVNCAFFTMFSSEITKPESHVFASAYVQTCNDWTLVFFFFFIGDTFSTNSHVSLPVKWRAGFPQTHFHCHKNLRG